MPGDLEGRRIALFAGAEGEPLKSALAGAGAVVEVLSDGQTHGEAEWHAGRYAAIVVSDGRDDGLEQKVVQLLRESLLTGKPIVLAEGSVPLIQRAGGTADDAVLVLRGGADAALANAAVRALSDRLEERRVDEMSDLSFPASDPPAINPASIGPRQGDSEAR